MRPSVRSRSRPPNQPAFFYPSTLFGQSRVGIHFRCNRCRLPLTQQARRNSAQRVSAWNHSNYMAERRRRDTHSWPPKSTLSPNLSPSAPSPDPPILLVQNLSSRRPSLPLSRAPFSTAYSYPFQPSDAAQTAHTHIPDAQIVPPFSRARQPLEPAPTQNSPQFPQTPWPPLSRHLARAPSLSQFCRLQTPPAALLL